MKRVILSVFACLALAAGARAAETCSAAAGRPDGALPSCVAVDAATSTITSATINTFGYRTLGVQIWSAAGSTATVNVNCRSYTTGPWYPCYTTSDPSAAGVYVSLPRAYQYQCHVAAWTAGTVSCVFERYNN